MLVEGRKNPNVFLHNPPRWQSVPENWEEAMQGAAEPTAHCALRLVSAALHSTPEASGNPSIHVRTALNSFSSYSKEQEFLCQRNSSCFILALQQGEGMKLSFEYQTGNIGPGRDFLSLLAHLTSAPNSPFIFSLLLKILPYCPLPLPSSEDSNVQGCTLLFPHLSPLECLWALQD